MKKLLCVLLTVIFLAGCTNTVQPTPTPIPTPTSTSEPTPTPEPTPIPYEDIIFDDGTDQELYSYVLDVYLEPGFGISPTLQAAMEQYEGQQKYYWVLVKVGWSSGGVQLLTAEEIPQLEDPKNNILAVLSQPPRPEGYPETVGDALAYLLENDAKETYRVGVFLKGTMCRVPRMADDEDASPQYTDFYNVRYELSNYRLEKGETHEEKQQELAELFGITEIAAIENEADAQGYLEEKLADVLKRHAISPVYQNVEAYFAVNYERRQDFPLEGVVSVAYFEADLSGEAIRALMEDEDVLYIDWKLEDGKQWMP